MRIVYRMRGLLGDATEEFIESLDSTTDEEEDEEEVYKMAGVMAPCGGLECMLNRLAGIKDFKQGRHLLTVSWRQQGGTSLVLWEKGPYGKKLVVIVPFNQCKPLRDLDASLSPLHLGSFFHLPCSWPTSHKTPLGWPPSAMFV